MKEEGLLRFLHIDKTGNEKTMELVFVNIMCLVDLLQIASKSWMS